MENSEDEVFSGALSLLADFFPKVAPIIHAAQFPATISDAIFEYKLKRLLSNAHPNLVEWLKIVWNFERCQKNYEQNVRKLICFLTTMNEDRVIDVYANLLHAYQLTLLNTDEFFRLSWILTKVYSDDLFLLKEFKPKTDYSENQRLEILEPYGLLNKRCKYGYNSKVCTRYIITELGKKMLACGINYEIYNEHK